MTSRNKGLDAYWKRYHDFRNLGYSVKDSKKYAKEGDTSMKKKMAVVSPKKKEVQNPTMKRYYELLDMGLATDEALILAETEAAKKNKSKIKMQRKRRAAIPKSKKYVLVSPKTKKTKKNNYKDITDSQLTIMDKKAVNALKKCRDARQKAINEIQKCDKEAKEVLSVNNAMIRRGLKTRKRRVGKYAIVPYTGEY